MTCSNGHHVSFLKAPSATGALAEKCRDGRLERARCNLKAPADDEISAARSHTSALPAAPDSPRLGDTAQAPDANAHCEPCNTAHAELPHCRSLDRTTSLPAASSRAHSLRSAALPPSWPAAPGSPLDIPAWPRPASPTQLRALTSRQGSAQSSSGASSHASFSLQPPPQRATAGFPPRLSAATTLPVATPPSPPADPSQREAEFWQMFEDADSRSAGSLRMSSAHGDSADASTLGSSLPFAATVWQPTSAADAVPIHASRRAGVNALHASPFAQPIRCARVGPGCRLFHRPTPFLQQRLATSAPVGPARDHSRPPSDDVDAQARAALALAASLGARSADALTHLPHATLSAALHAALVLLQARLVEERSGGEDTGDRIPRCASTPDVPAPAAAATSPLRGQRSLHHARKGAGRPEPSLSAAIWRGFDDLAASKPAPPLPRPPRVVARQTLRFGRKRGGALAGRGGAARGAPAALQGPALPCRLHPHVTRAALEDFDRPTSPGLPPPQPPAKQPIRALEGARLTIPDFFPQATFRSPPSAPHAARAAAPAPAAAVTAPVNVLASPPARRSVDEERPASFLAGGTQSSQHHVVCFSPGDRSELPCPELSGIEIARYFGSSELPAAGCLCGRGCSCPAECAANIAADVRIAI